MVTMGEHKVQTPVHRRSLQAPPQIHSYSFKGSSNIMRTQCLQSDGDIDGAQLRGSEGGQMKWLHSDQQTGRETCRTKDGEENESRTEGMMGKRSDRCCTLSQQMVELEEEKGKVGRDGDKDAERRKAEYSERENRGRRLSYRT